MRGELTVQVMPRGRDLQTDAGQVELMRFERDHLLPSETLGDGDGLVGRTAGLIGVGNFVRDLIGAGVALEPFDRQRKIVGILGHDLRVERRLACRPADDDCDRRPGRAARARAGGESGCDRRARHFPGDAEPAGSTGAPRRSAENREHHDGQRHDARFQQRHRPIIASRMWNFATDAFPTTIYSRAAS